ncbi:MAG: PAS domain S-box protein [Polaromonas sp.]
MSLAKLSSAWPASSGEVAELMRRLDWEKTPLGPCPSWPQSLRTVLDLVLPASAQMALFWGPEQLAFYNDAYAPLLGRHHPQALGQPRSNDPNGFWGDLAPLLMGVWQSGVTFSAQGYPFLDRQQEAQEPVYFDLSLSAVRDEAGAVAGVLCIVSEATQRLLAQQIKRAREKAESDLREMHDQLRLAEAAGGIGTFLLEIQTDTIIASAEFCRLFGLPVSRTLPARVMEPFFQSPSDAVLADEASGQRKDALLNVEYRINKADTGEMRWISRRAEFVLDDSGDPVWMRGVVQDVTDRKLVQATLQESESRFRVLAQAVPNQVWSATPEGKLDWVNQKVLDYFGLEEEKMLGGGWSGLIHPADLRRVNGQWLDALQHKTRYETEFRLRRRDGIYRWHLVRALPIALEGATRWLGANTDIEEQKAAQAELAQLNATLEERVAQHTRDRDRMWHLSTDLILVAGFDGVITSANPAWEKLLGWHEREIVGKPMTQLVHEDDRQRTDAQVQGLSVERTPQRFENRYRHRDDSYKTISWIAVPDSERIHAVGRDISIERESALALKDSEDRLRQSQKMEAIGQLTGGIAHDFNNLLQGISGSIDVVRGRLAAGRTDDVEHYMDAATQLAKRAAALIHRLLAFARRQSLESKTVDINRLVISMEELMRRTLGAHIELVVDGGEGVWLARSDDNQLESAVLNLAVNARDAMPDGGTLTIRTANVALEPSYTRLHEGLQPGDYVLISVSDTGGGMPPDVLGQVFEPFFTTKPIGQGTGLGLSMIYGFAKQSNGHVRIHSQVGQGTEVCLYMPRHADGAAGNTSEAPASPSVSRLQGEGETLLVVEDDPAVRMIVLDELAELGYNLLEAIDGPTAIAILQSARKIDLLITDVGLPGMNGRQIAEIGRQHRPELPVLFMTGYAQNAAARSKFLAPGMEMISKPFSMDDMAAKIRDMLSGDGPTSETPPAGNT